MSPGKRGRPAAIAAAAPWVERRGGSRDVLLSISLAVGEVIGVR